MSTKIELAVVHNWIKAFVNFFHHTDYFLNCFDDLFQFFSQSSEHMTRRIDYVAKYVLKYWKIFLHNLSVSMFATVDRVLKRALSVTFLMYKKEHVSKAIQQQFT